MSERSEPRLRTTPEWITFALSVAVLLLVVGLLVAQLIGGSDPANPEAVVVTVDIEQRGARFAVPVEVTNEGDRGAQSVAVSAELVAGGATTTASQTIDFLGAGETVELVFLFDDDPTAGDLTATVDGFVVP